MKQMLRAVIRALWRASAPLRRPLVRKIDAKVMQAVGVAIQAEVQPIRQQLQEIPAGLRGLELALNHARYVTDNHLSDTNLVLDSVVRELARLQRQIEILQEMVQDGAVASARLSVVGEPEAEERLLVG
ncbi:MAG: hypothetical protein IRY99_01900 [Isosphaeraceae bacterium]|nr:hypothetical protein [Isosphaeraceae bacterium]